MSVNAPGYESHRHDRDSNRDRALEPAPLLSLSSFLLMLVIEAAWVWVLWKGINYLADRVLFGG